MEYYLSMAPHFLSAMRDESSVYESEELWKRSLNLSDNERFRIQKIIKLIPSSANSILDCGCGAGSICNVIQAPNVIGVDFSRTALKYVKVEKIIADVRALPFKEKCFDTLIVSELLEHLDDKSFDLCIKEILRLRPMNVIISSPYKERLEVSMTYCPKCQKFFHIYHHKRKITPEEIDHQLSGYTRKETIFTTKIHDTPNCIIKIEQIFGLHIFDQGVICEDLWIENHPTTIYAKDPF